MPTVPLPLVASRTGPLQQIFSNIQMDEGHFDAKSLSPRNGEGGPLRAMPSILRKLTQKSVESTPGNVIAPPPDQSSAREAANRGPTSPVPSSVSWHTLASPEQVAWHPRVAMSSSIREQQVMQDAVADLTFVKPG